jgi:hypothetical protein
MLWEVFALIGSYPPKIDGVDKSRDRTAGVSWRERYGVPESNVMKEEMQRGGVFEERIKPAKGDDGSEWGCTSGYRFTHSSCTMWAGGSSIAIHAIEVEGRGAGTAAPIRYEYRCDKSARDVPTRGLEEDECDGWENSVEENRTDEDSSEGPGMGDC